MSLTTWTPPARRPRSSLPHMISEQQGSHEHLGLVSSIQPLPRDVCEELRALGRSYPRDATTVVGQQQLTDHRVGYVHMMPCEARTQRVYGLLWDAAVDATQRHYRLKISGITRMPHYVEYHAGCGHFHWHDDYSHESREAPRKLTVIVQLSDGSDYEGGDFEVFGSRITTAPRALGTIICLPSFVVHRVTPITAGVRSVLVAWIAGPRVS